MKIHYQAKPDSNAFCVRWKTTWPVTQNAKAVTCDRCLHSMALRGISTEPPEVVRTIRLPLAKDTTETECGSCPLGDGPLCRAFRSKEPGWFSEVRPVVGYRYQRLPECVAAEKA